MTWLGAAPWAGLALGAWLHLLLLASGCGASAPEPEGPPPGDPVADVAPEDLMAIGRAYADRGDLIRAEQYFAAAVARGYPERQALPLLIDACVRSSRLGAALAHAKPVLARHPTDWRLRLVVASLYMGLGQVQDGRSELQRVVELAPDEPLPHYMLAVLLRDEIQDGQGALRHFRRYLELAPEGPHVEEARAFHQPLPLTE